MSVTNTRERIHAAVIRLLHEERLRQDMSMYQLAPKAGLSQSALRLIELGERKPTLDTLLRVAEALGIELGEILIQATKDVRAGWKPGEVKKTGKTKARSGRAG